MKDSTWVLALQYALSPYILVKILQELQQIRRQCCLVASLATWPKAKYTSMFHFVHAKASTAPVGATRQAKQRPNITTEVSATTPVYGGGLHS